MTDVAAVGTILGQSLQGTQTEVWWYGYSQGAFVMVQVTPAAHAIALATAAYALFKLTGTLLAETHED